MAVTSGVDVQFDWLKKPRRSRAMMNGRLAAFGRLLLCPAANISSASKFSSEISVGFSAECTRTFSEDEIRQFSVLSCDDNPLHLSKDYAEGTRFGSPIIHGTLILRSVFNERVHAPSCAIFHDCIGMFSACFPACCTSILEEREASLSPLLPSSERLVS